MIKAKQIGRLQGIVDNITKIPLSNSLAQALSIIEHMKAEDIEGWLTLELSGYYDSNPLYKKNPSLPEYRKVPGFFQNKFKIKLEVEDPELVDVINNYYLRHGVQELEAYLEDSDGLAQIHDQGANSYLKQKFNVEVDWFVFNPKSILTILTAIRTKFLNLIIDYISKAEQKLEEDIEVNIHPLESLHSEIIRIAKPLFDSEHYRNAILDASISLIAEVRNKSGVKDKDNTPLMAMVFDEKDPILKLSDNSDEQFGFKMMFMGAVMGLRNAKSHEIIEQRDKQRTIEWLSFLSILYRLMDQSQKSDE